MPPLPPAPPVSPSAPWSATRTPAALRLLAVQASPAAAAAPTAVGWRWARLLSAPHRLAFFAGALGLAVSAGWWALALLLPALGVGLPWAVAPGVAHGLWMTAGFMPMFIAGFLFTAGPKWLGLPEVPARWLLGPVLQFGTGWALALPGFHLSSTLAAGGLALVLVAWMRLLWRFTGLLQRSPVADRLHAQGVALACLQGALGLAVALGGLLWAEVPLQRAALAWLVWAFLAPCFVVVAHRMLPFFTAAALPRLDAWRPRWLLGALIATLALGALDATLAAWGVAWPAAVHAALALAHGLAGAGLVALAWRWGLVHSRHNRLLAMLHGGFVWLGLAWVLLAASHAGQATGGPGLGLAPLHALTLGHLGCTLVAMITRVAAGHSGRPLAVDGRVWALYGLLQATTVLRVLASLVGWQPLLLASAVGWATVALGWTWRYAPWLGQPRADGRPG